MEILKISLTAYMFVSLGQNRGMIFYPYQKKIKKLPKWISWPLGRCYKCFVGQVCFWYFIFTNPFQLENIASQIIDLAFFVSAGIALSMVFHKIDSML